VAEALKLPCAEALARPDPYFSGRFLLIHFRRFY
jgi:hypothetical protein